MRILILGGTGEARSLATRLVERGHNVTTSLAGRVRDPRLPVGSVRIGGFGGVDGLRSAAADFAAVIDATHPFAAGISANAAAACTTVPLLRLERPGWQVRDGWLVADDHDEAARLAAAAGRRPLLTIGRQSLGQFVGPLRDQAVLARVVDSPEVVLPSTWQVLRDRGPYSLSAELNLLRQHAADVLVTKDSGGDLTSPKLDAATELGLTVVVVRRPSPPPGVLTVSTVEDVLSWLDEREKR